MLMGMLAAPGWFQHVINSVLDSSGVDAANAFLDDIIIRGIAAYWQLSWEATLKVIRKLTRFQFMLNLGKC